VVNLLQREELQGPIVSIRSGDRHLLKHLVLERKGQRDGLSLTRYFIPYKIMCMVCKEESSRGPMANFQPRGHHRLNSWH